LEDRYYRKAADKYESGDEEEQYG